MILQTGHSDDVLCASFSADARFIITGSANGEVKLWETAGGREIRTLYGKQGEVPAVSITRDGLRSAAAYEDGTVFVWDSSTGALMFVLKTEGRRIHAVAFSPDGSMLAAGGEDTYIYIWESETGRLFRKMTGAVYGTVTGISWNEESSLFAVSSADKSVRLIDPFSGLRTKTFIGHTEAVTSCAFSSDGKQIVSAGRDKTVRVWDTGGVKTAPVGSPFVSNEKVITYSGADFISISFSPGGRYAAAGGSRTVRVFDTVSGETAASFSAGMMSALSVTFSADGSRLAVTNTDNSIDIFDVTDKNPVKWKKIRTLSGYSANVLFTAVTPDASQVVFGNLSDSRIFFADAVTGKKTMSAASHTRPVSAGIFTKGGSFFIAGGYDGVVKFYKTPAGAEKQPWTEAGSFAGHSGPVRFIAHNSANGDTATADEKGNIIIWKYLIKKIRTDSVPPDSEAHEFIAEQRAVQQTIRLYEEKCTALAYTADGKFLVSSSDNGKIYAAETDSYRTVKIAGAHAGSVNALVFTADGRYMASSGSDSFIKIWNVSNWSLVRSLDTGKLVPSILLFSPDDSMIAAACSDNSIIVIDALTGKKLRTLTGHQRAVTALVSLDASNGAQRGADGSASLTAGRFVSASADGSLCWRSFTSNRWSTALKCIGPNEFLLWNYDGYYNGTPWAVKNLLHFSAGMEVYPLDMKNGVLYRPDIGVVPVIKR